MFGGGVLFLNPRPKVIDHNCLLSVLNVDCGLMQKLRETKHPFEPTHSSFPSISVIGLQVAIHMLLHSLRQWECVLAEPRGLQASPHAGHLPAGAIR